MTTACRSKLPALAALCLVAAIAQSAYAQGKDELWEMTTKMEMEGMPMAMPAQTNKVCVEAGKSEAAVPAGDSDCRMSSVKRSGSKTTFRMECTQPEKMTGTGEITRTKDSMSGTISLKGDDMNMKQTFSGRRVGSCDAKTYAQAQRRQVMGQQMDPLRGHYEQACAEGVEKLDARIFDAKPFMAEGMSEEEKAQIRDMVSCDKIKPKFCGKAREVGKSMRTPKGDAAARSAYHDIDAALRLCGEDLAAIQAAACTNGVSGREWDFVSRRCPAQAKEIAAKNCVGRDYTEVMSKTPEEYRVLCSSHAPQRGMAAAPGAPSSNQGAKGSTTEEAIKEGTNALRKFLKF